MTSALIDVRVLKQASHYIGLGYDVILCIQELPCNAVVNGEQVSN